MAVSVVLLFSLPIFSRHRTFRLFGTCMIRSTLTPPDTVIFLSNGFGCMVRGHLGHRHQGAAQPTITSFGPCCGCGARSPSEPGRLYSLNDILVCSCYFDSDLHEFSMTPTPNQAYKLRVSPSS